MVFKKLTEDYLFLVLLILALNTNFDFPLVLSLDIRPEIGLLGYSEFSDNFDFDIGLGIRYQF